MLEIVAGWESREAIGHSVCQFSAIRRTTEPLCFIPLMEKPLRFRGLYQRPHEDRNGQLWDVISDAPMATTFAVSRFLTPWLATADWVLSCDFADMLFMADPAKLFAHADERFAVQVVKHRYQPSESLKMDGQAQTVYARKNWSSVILWNRKHRSNWRLTEKMVNTLPGRDLHRFCWLKDHEIGDLPSEWNWLVGAEPEYETLGDVKPALLHYTSGLPTMRGYESGPWVREWRQELAILDATRGRISAAA
jgi:hypothetical protein